MTCICVLGMHRSGTSCLTGIMQAFGVELGEVFTENLYNKKGNRENSRIVYLNDHVLDYNGAAWNRPAVVSRWTPGEAGERDAIIAELSGRTSGYWGFKDTRTLFTLPFWLEALDTPRFIGTFRHPQRVALSLNNRDGAPFEDSWVLWHTYNRRLLDLANEYDFALVDFDRAPDDYLDDTIAKLLALGLDASRADAAREFFDSGLRNQAASVVEDVKLPAQVAALYDELREYDRNRQ
jgi:hypothetical protein